jgi:protein-disulfide isomerase
VSKKTARKARAATKTPPPVRGRAAGTNRFWIYVGVAGVVIVAAVALIVTSVVGGKEKTTSSPAAVDGASTEQLLSGIQQTGTTLGDPGAAVTLVEFADPQCPFCQQFDTEILPSLVDTYVRNGDVQIVYKTFPFIGEDSEKASRAIHAAADQGKAWNVVDLLYKNQGGENEGWVSDELLAAIGAAVPGLDAEKWLADMDAPAAADAVASDVDAAQAAGVDGTPYFQIGATGAELESIGVTALDLETFTKAIDEQLGK